jgi:hypothetical protein
MGSPAASPTVRPRSHHTLVDERKAGIVIAAAPCPMLVVTGTADTQWPRQRYDDLPFVADRFEADGATH